MSNINFYWWNSPYKLALYFWLPVYLGLSFSALSCDNGGNICGDYYYLGLSYFIVFPFFSFMGYFVFHDTFQAKRVKYVFNMNIVIRFLDFSFYLALISYFLWFYRVLINPSLILNVLFTNEMNLRHVVSTIPGVTTFSQAGFFFSSLFFSLKYYSIKLPSRMKLFLFILIILSLFRALLWSERLAFIEMLIPVVLYWASLNSRRKLLSFLKKGMPVFGFGFLYVIFSLGEYFRSWSFYSAGHDGNFLQYSFERLISYYSTSVSNGIAFLTYENWPNLYGHFTLEWMYKIPWLGGVLSSIVNNDIDWSFFLFKHANPEFNNPSGIFSFFMDFGWLGIIQIAFYGLISGLVYRGVMGRNPVSMLLYPVFFLSWVEIFRIFYFGESRFFPLIVLFMIFILLKPYRKVYVYN